MYSITKEWKFEAAHSLRNVPPEHQCSRQHGHSYRVELQLVSEMLDIYDMVIDYGILDHDFGLYVKDFLDHRDLNVVFGHMETTAENLAKEIYDFCRSQFHWGPILKRVTVRETGTTSASYGN